MSWPLQRPSALLNNLAASALIILAWDPFQLFDAGFQLSFMVVTALIILAPLLEEKIYKPFSPDPYIPQNYIPQWRLRLVPAVRWTTALVAVSLAAWIGSFGLNLYYFNIVSFTALVANLIIVPLASASVALGLISLLLGMAWDQIGITLNTAHALIVHWMVTISEKLASIQAGYWYVPQLKVEWVVAGYAVTIAIFLLFLQRKKLKAWSLTATSVLLIGVLGFRAWNSDRIQIDIMDVGSGQAVLMTGPRFERILVDAGNKKQGQWTIKPFLRSRGVNSIDLAIVSHGDAGHYGGFQEILGEIPIHKIAVADASFRSKGYKILLDQIQKSRVPTEKWGKGDVKEMKCGNLSVLWPEHGANHSRADDSCLIFRLKTKHGFCLFAADAGESTEKILAEPPVPCSFLVQGLHSNEESLSEIFLQKLKPEFIVLNTADFPSTAIPSATVQNRLKESRAQIYQTDQLGGVKINLDESGISLVTRLQP